MGLKLNTASSGSVTLEPANTASNYTLTVPAQTGTVVATDSSGNVGIGTSSPNQAITIQRGGSDAAAITMRAAGNSASTECFVGQGGDSAFYIYNRANSAMLFATNNAERMRIDSSGRVTKPYQPAFSVTEMSITIFNANTGAASYMNGGIVKTNVGSCYNSTTGRFTAPVAGTYLITAAVLVNSGTGRLEGQLYINGSGSGFAFNGTGSTYDGPSVTAVLTLAANDYVTISRVSGTAYNSHGNNNFSGFLIG